MQEKKNIKQKLNFNNNNKKCYFKEMKTRNRELIKNRMKNNNKYKILHFDGLGI